eukprot:TRINITY_DN43775_c0_g1_i1.p1 TRINITY_DN43775_c0_g1~~TRINITY_DN43775_c0_g1_i1.p1  ORF type:complete len:246 (-),score=31.01 TRINITY_DN43775_c0_g1_i1:154-891(-)
MAWANPIIARLATGDRCSGEYCGLVVVSSWPMPHEVLEQYERWRDRLVEAMPPEAYVYPGSSLHSTVCTLRSFLAGPLADADRQDLRARWSDVLDKAAQNDSWPKDGFKLRIDKPRFEGSAGIFDIRDVDGAIARIRSCLQEAILAAGGKACSGADKAGGKPLPGGEGIHPAPHLPDIVHSTVLRWKAEPSSDRDAIKASFALVAESWEPLEVTVSSVRAVFEDAPYMHIPDEPRQIWWESRFDS